MADLPDEDMAAVAAAEAALNLLALTGELTAQSARLTAIGEGTVDELRAQADYVAQCLTAPQRTRSLASDLMKLAAVEARRHLGRDESMTGTQLKQALQFVDLFELHVRNSVLD